MKRNLFALMSLMLLNCAAISLLNNNRIEHSKADESAIVDIDYLYSIQPVSFNTKVIISDWSMLSWFDSIGRTYYSEYINIGGGGGGDLPGPGTLNNPDNPDGGGMQVLQYYYYATATEPKIIGRTMMNNTYSSLKIAFQYLEGLASYYGCSDIKNAVLGYVRSINWNYVSENWGRVAGSLDSSFINYVDSLTSIGMTIKEYYASFVLDSNDYNSGLHGTVSSSILQEHLKIYSPFTGDADIDLTHLVASIDGVYTQTGSNYYYPPYNTITPRTYRYLCSWAGDMQTSVMYISDPDNNSYPISNFSQILNNSSSSFGYSDFYADVDAINIGRLLSDNNSSVSVTINSYISSTNSNQDRMYTFVQNIIQMDNSNSQINELTFRTIVYEMLHMDADGNETNGETYGTCCIKYKLMGYSPFNPSLPNISFRQNIASCFVDYVSDIAF